MPCLNFHSLIKSEVANDLLGFMATLHSRTCFPYTISKLQQASTFLTFDLINARKKIFLSRHEKGQFYIQNTKVAEAFVKKTSLKK